MDSNCLYRYICFNFFAFDFDLNKEKLVLEKKLLPII